MIKLQFNNKDHIITISTKQNLILRSIALPLHFHVNGLHLT